MPVLTPISQKLPVPYTWSDALISKLLSEVGHSDHVVNPLTYHLPLWMLTQPSLNIKDCLSTRRELDSACPLGSYLYVTETQSLFYRGFNNAVNTIARRGVAESKSTDGSTLERIENDEEFDSAQDCYDFLAKHGFTKPTLTSTAMVIRIDNRFVSLVLLSGETMAALKQESPCALYLDPCDDGVPSELTKYLQAIGIPDNRVIALTPSHQMKRYASLPIQADLPPDQLGELLTSAGANYSPYPYNLSLTTQWLKALLETQVYSPWEWQAIIDCKTSSIQSDWINQFVMDQFWNNHRLTIAALVSEFSADYPLCLVDSSLADDLPGDGYTALCFPLATVTQRMTAEKFSHLLGIYMMDAIWETHANHPDAPGEHLAIMRLLQDYNHLFRYFSLTSEETVNAFMATNIQRFCAELIHPDLTAIRATLEGLAQNATLLPRGAAQKKWLESLRDAVFDEFVYRYHAHVLFIKEEKNRQMKRQLLTIFKRSITAEEWRAWRQDAEQKTYGITDDVLREMVLSPYLQDACEAALAARVASGCWHIGLFIKKTLPGIRATNNQPLPKNLTTCSLIDLQDCLISNPPPPLRALKEYLTPYAQALSLDTPLAQNLQTVFQALLIEYLLTPLCTSNQQWDLNKRASKDTLDRVLQWIFSQPSPSSVLDFRRKLCSAFTTQTLLLAEYQKLSTAQAPDVADDFNEQLRRLFATYDHDTDQIAQALLLQDHYTPNDINSTVRTNVTNLLNFLKITHPCLQSVQKLLDRDDVFVSLSTTEKKFFCRDVLEKVAFLGYTVQEAEVHNTQPPRTPKPQPSSRALSPQEDIEGEGKDSAQELLPTSLECAREWLLTTPEEWAARHPLFTQLKAIRDGHAPYPSKTGPEIETADQIDYAVKEQAFRNSQIEMVCFELAYDFRIAAHRACFANPTDVEAIEQIKTNNQAWCQLPLQAVCEGLDYTTDLYFAGTKKRKDQALALDSTLLSQRQQFATQFKEDKSNLSQLLHLSQDALVEALCNAAVSYLSERQSSLRSWFGFVLKHQRLETRQDAATFINTSTPLGDYFQFEWNAQGMVSGTATARFGDNHMLDNVQKILVDLADKINGLSTKTDESSQQQLRDLRLLQAKIHEELSKLDPSLFTWDAGQRTLSLIPLNHWLKQQENLLRQQALREHTEHLAYSQLAHWLVDAANRYAADDEHPAWTGDDRRIHMPQSEISRVFAGIVLRNEEGNFYINPAITNASLDLWAVTQGIIHTIVQERYQQGPLLSTMSLVQGLSIKDFAPTTGSLTGIPNDAILLVSSSNTESQFKQVRIPHRIKKRLPNACLPDRTFQMLFQHLYQADSNYQQVLNARTGCFAFLCRGQTSVVELAILEQRVDTLRKLIVQWCTHINFDKPLSVREQETLKELINQPAQDAEASVELGKALCGILNSRYDTQRSYNDFYQDLRRARRIGQEVELVEISTEPGTIGATL